MICVVGQMECEVFHIYMGRISYLYVHINTHVHAQQRRFVVHDIFILD